MKVLLANSLYLPNIGGVENYIRSLALTLTQKGHTVEVICSDYTPSAVQSPAHEEKREEAYVRRFSYKGPLRAYTTQQFSAAALVQRRAAAVGGFDHVFARSHHAVIICRVAGISRVTFIPPGVYANQSSHLRSALSIRQRIKYWLNVYAQRLALRLCAETVVLSQTMAEQVNVETRGRVQPRVVPAGVDKARFYPRSSAERRRHRRALQLPERARIVAGLGRFTTVKGFDHAVRALAYLPNDVHLVLAGEGGEAHVYRQHAEALGVTDRLSILPATDQPESVYAGADAFVLPSSHESFGQVLLEATASGLPIAAFASGSVVQTATSELYHEFPALAALSQEFSPQGLARAIAHALATDSGDAQFKVAWEEFVAKYSWDRVAADLIKTHTQCRSNV